MNPIEHIAYVSASHCPIQEILQKRQFQSNPGTIFSNIKKRKLENSVQKLEYESPSNFSYNSFINSSVQEMTANNDSRTILATSNKSSPYPLNATTSYNEAMNTRQKFKARPIPNSLYKPNLILKGNEKSITQIKEFNLTTPSPHKFQQNCYQSEGFKARPMPKFSNPFTPQQFPSQFKPTSLNFSEYSTDISLNISSSTPSNNNTFISTPKSLQKSANHGNSSLKLFSKSMSCISNDFSQNFNRTYKEFESTIPMDIELHTSMRAQDRDLFEERLREQER